MITFEKITNNGNKIPFDVAETVRKRGFLVIKDVIPEDETREIMKDFVKYAETNGAFPGKNNQTVYEIYWSKAQMRARQHPNMYAVHKALLNLWHLNVKGEF